MRINISKTKVMSELIPVEQRQVVLLDSEPLEDVDKFKCLGSMFVANGQGTEEIKSSINIVLPHSLDCSPVFGRGVKYRCVKRTESTRQ